MTHLKYERFNIEPYVRQIESFCDSAIKTIVSSKERQKIMECYNEDIPFYKYSSPIKLDDHFVIVDFILYFYAAFDKSVYNYNVDGAYGVSLNSKGIVVLNLYNICNIQSIPDEIFSDEGRFMPMLVKLVRGNRDAIVKTLEHELDHQLFHSKNYKSFRKGQSHTAVDSSDNLKSIKYGSDIEFLIYFLFSNTELLSHQLSGMASNSVSKKVVTNYTDNGPISRIKKFNNVDLSSIEETLQFMKDLSPEEFLIVAEYMSTADIPFEKWKQIISSAEGNPGAFKKWFLKEATNRLNTVKEKSIKNKMSLKATLADQNKLRDLIYKDIITDGKSESVFNWYSRRDDITYKLVLQKSRESSLGEFYNVDRVSLKERKPVITDVCLYRSDKIRQMNQNFDDFFDRLYSRLFSKLH